MSQQRKLDPIDRLLFIGMMVFSVIIFVCNVMFPMDGQIFQVYSGVLGAFSGAFFARLKDSKSNAHPENKTDPSDPTHTEPGK